MGKSTPFAIDYGYVNAGRMSNPPSQSEKFKAAAKEEGCDESEARWTDRLKNLVRRKPAKAK